MKRQRHACKGIQQVFFFFFFPSDTYELVWLANSQLKRLSNVAAGKWKLPSVILSANYLRPGADLPFVSLVRARNTHYSLTSFLLHLSAPYNTVLLHLAVSHSNILLSLF